MYLQLQELQVLQTFSFFTSTSIEVSHIGQLLCLYSGERMEYVALTDLRSLISVDFKNEGTEMIVNL